MHQHLSSQRCCSLYFRLNHADVRDSNDVTIMRTLQDLQHPPMHWPAEPEPRVFCRSYCRSAGFWIHRKRDGPASSCSSIINNINSNNNNDNYYCKSEDIACGVWIVWPGPYSLISQHGPLGDGSLIIGCMLTYVQFRWRWRLSFIYWRLHTNTLHKTD